MEKFKFKIIVLRSKFQTQVLNLTGEIIYFTEIFDAKEDSINAAKDWVFWFQNAPSNNAISIYYILAIPDNWMGGSINKNPYDGLQVKIGITKNVRQRIRSLKTGSESKLIIHAMEPGSRKKELELHKKFESDRRQGEWFACSLLIYKHIMETWKKNILLPPEYQAELLNLSERIRIYRSIRKDGKTFDMINPSVNDEWNGSVFLDLTYSNIADNM
ncbi:hypothetical protein L1276_000886 [Flavobacterium sp. HSC-32F16]|uniref:GIY-YIG nuclease family protein n=1 Tax=Flavobacterium sp. HSC-32F16 TaxID=2910964 RepID=UPI0020A506EA|nr:GIY-YIG nuclease family protein [Flavobacterium sp. HSC-32F16]MCP2025746.1 hypothetical protein [Flavobacterium sp. HSC-32F16]